jgi:hypothetical protein
MEQRTHTANAEPMRRAQRCNAAPARRQLSANHILNGANIRPAPRDAGAGCPRHGR